MASFPGSVTWPPRYGNSGVHVAPYKGKTVSKCMCMCVHEHASVCMCAHLGVHVFMCMHMYVYAHMCNMSLLKKLTTESIPGVDSHRSQERLVRVADAVVEGEH